MLVCPVVGGFGTETNFICVADAEREEEVGEDGAGMMEAELAGRTLAHNDGGDCGRVVVFVNVGLNGKEQGLLVALMGKEAAVVLDCAISKAGPVEIVQVVAVESVLGSEDSLSVLCLGRHRLHSALHVRRESERCDHRVILGVASGWNLQGYIGKARYPETDDV
jgi:hypothetical protein